MFPLSSPRQDLEIILWHVHGRVKCFQVASIDEMGKSPSGTVLRITGNKHSTWKESRNPNRLNGLALLGAHLLVKSGHHFKGAQNARKPNRTGFFQTISMVLPANFPKVRQPLLPCTMGFLTNRWVATPFLSEKAPSITPCFPA